MGAVLRRARSARPLRLAHRLAFLLPILLPVVALAGCAVNSSKLAPGQKLEVRPDVMTGYDEYLHAKGSGTGAFAVTLSGDGYAYYYCPGMRCLGGASAAAPQAIQSCESHGDKCVLFARDDGIIVPYEVAQ